MFRFFFLLILIGIISFSSCNKPMGIKGAVINAHSAAVSFYKGDGSMDTVLSPAAKEFLVSISKK
jgi:hypothetical protein